MKQIVIGRIEVPFKMTKKQLEHCIKKATENTGVHINYEDVDVFLKPKYAEEVKKMGMGMTESLLDPARKALNGSWNPPVGGK